MPKQGKSSSIGNTTDPMSSALDLIIGFAHSLSQKSEGCAPGDMTSRDLVVVLISIVDVLCAFGIGIL